MSFIHIWMNCFLKTELRLEIRSFRPFRRTLCRNKKAPRAVMDGRGAEGRLAARYFPALLGAVSSPRGPLTAVFGMGTGVSAPQGPPTKGFRRRGNARRAPHRRRPRRPLGRARGVPRARWRGGGQAARPIRTPRLSASPRLHLGPVNPVVSRGPSEARAWDGGSPGGLGA